MSKKEKGKEEGAAAIPLVPLSPQDRENAIFAYACPVCRTIYEGENGKSDAEECCAPRLCESCGEPVGFNRIMCSRCWAEDQNKRILEEEKSSAAKAHRVTRDEYSGPVFCGAMREREGFFDSMEDLLERCGGKMPEHPVFACRVFPFALDMESALDSALEEFPDGFGTIDLVDLKELEKFVEEWNAKQTIARWEPDWTIVVTEGEGKECEGRDE